MASSESILHPAASITKPVQTSPSRLWLVISRSLHILPLVVIASVVSAYALRLVFAPTLWLDEAMLVLNIQTIAWVDLFKPLPFYDQVAPLAYIALLKAIHSIAGLQEGLLRLPSLVALIASLLLITRLPATDRIARLIAAAMLAGSFVTVRLATDAKPYMLEVMFALALITAFHPMAAGIWTKTWFRLGLLIGAATTTTAFPLVAFAVGAPAVLTEWRRDMTARRPIAQWQCLKPAILFGVALLFYIVYFTTYLADSLRLVAENHAYGYAADGYNTQAMTYLQWFTARFVDIVRSHWSTAPTVVMFFVISGIYALVRDRSIYGAQFAALLGFIITLNLTGHFPVMEGRFSMFMLPWLGIVVGAGVCWTISLLPRPPIRQIAVTAAAMLMLTPAIKTLADPFHQQARASLAHIRATPDIPLVTSIASQPIIDTYLKPGPANRFDCTVAQATASTTRCTAAKAAGDGNAFSNSATKWYLMNYIAVSTWGGSDSGFPGRSVKQFSAAYFDWLVAELRRHKRAHFLLHQGNETVMAALRSRLLPTERLTKMIDERPASPTLSHSAAQLFLFENTGPSSTGSNLNQN